ncbi:hypothetical protein [Tepidibacter sp. Z1-5]|uniref:hypothetical protein n=1 Tax=Tepidibacter sp. Z1-5 TaxID=3134138 RepID=UPI0030BD9506
MFPYINKEGLLACPCGNTNLLVAGSKHNKVTQIPVFSIICVNCSKKKNKLNHVCGLGTIKDLIERDCDIKYHNKVFENIISKQLEMPYNSETGEIYICDFIPQIEF